MEAWSDWSNTFNSLIDVLYRNIISSKFLQRLVFVLFIVIEFSCQYEKSTGILVANTGQTQGTYYHIKYIIEDAKNLENDIDSVLTIIDNSLSTYNKTFFNF